MLLPLKNLVSFCFATLILLFLSATSNAQKPDHATGDVIVMLKKGMEVHELTTQFAEFNNQETGLTAIQQLSARLNIWLLRFNADAVNESKLLSALRGNELVSLAQFNHYIESRNIPNDERFGEQWNMLNIGQTGGTSGADVRATDAWDITTGGLTASGDTIVVAIDDDGFDLLHADLDFWKNKLEIPGNSIDDDENGYVDDYDGWNSQTNSGTITSLSSGHGTHVAGIAAAKGNNSIGVSGVNWNVKILPVQGNSGLESVAVAGYAYILEMRAKYNETNGEEGAFVVSANSSWGVNNGLPSNFPIWCAMYDSMGLQGILNAAATSNSSNVNVDVQGDMPTACGSDYLVTVTNTDKNDMRGGAYGATTIDLGAPGTAVLSTIPGSQYGSKTGTSMSSPHVAGAIALLCAMPCEALANDLKNDAAATMLRIKGFILDAVDPAVSLDGLTVSGGRLNVKQAMNNAAAYYNCNVGIDETANLPATVRVYPNPASTEITVSPGNNLNGNVIVTILNLLGQEVMNQKVFIQGSAGFKMDISDLAKDIYMLRLTTETGATGCEKIIIN